MQCQACGADLPDDAQYCIECGARATGAASTGATVRLPMAAVACRTCGTANPGRATFCVSCGRPVRAPAPAPAPSAPQSVTGPAAYPASRRRRGRGGPGSGLWMGLLFVAGMVALVFLKLPLMPGMLILIGLTAFAGAALRGNYLGALGAAIWFFGIIFLIRVPSLIVPGILALGGLNILLALARRALRGP